METFKIEIQDSNEYPDVVIVLFKGDMGLSSIATISDTFQHIIKTGNNFFVIADFSEVETISSAAIGKLMRCRSSLIEKEGDLIFTNLGLEVLKAFNTLEANKIFKICGDIRSAVALYNWEYQGLSEEISFSFPPELFFVPPVRQMVRRLARQKGYNNKDAFRIETIVDEICNNAVEHGDHSEKREIKVTVLINKKKIELKITNVSDPQKIDSLRKFSEYLSQPEPSFDNMRGRGLVLVKMLSNDFQIDNSSNGTSVHVTKFREE